MGRLAILVVVLAVVGLDLWIRFAPDDPARWNVSIGAPGPATPGPCADKVVTVPRGARADCLLPGTPEKLLVRLDAVALAHPRTHRLAGTPGEGRITWVSRSLIWGFPDYITAQAVAAPGGTRLDILSRQRYGEGDMGVNAARLKDWLGAL